MIFKRNREVTYYTIAIAIQLVLVGYIFSELIFNPSSYMLYNQYDGLKNYYTLVTYVLQDASFGYGYYSFMNYPIGDYVVFTDNTPALAVIMRFWHLNIFSLKGLIIPIFNFIILSNFIVAFVLSFAIGRKLNMKFWLSMLLAFALSWFNPMSVGLVSGVPNLSLTSFILADILLVIIIFRNLKKPEQKNYLVLYFSLFFLLVVSAFFHIYYLAIEGIFTGVFLIGLLIVFHKDKKAVLRIMGTFTILLLATITVLLVLKVTDPFHAIRPEKADGYGWSPWTMSISGIFKGLPFLKFSFFKQQTWEEGGQFGFIGHFAHAIGFLWLVIQVFFRRKKHLSIQKNSATVLVRLIIIAGTISLFTSIGNSIYVFDWFKFDNILSPFFFARKFISQVEHFRFLTRLQWPFFFAINIWAFYQFDSYLQSDFKKPVKQLLLFIGLTVIAVDAYSFLHFYKSASYKSTLNEQALEKIPELHFNKYQAVLPIPYFQVGNEEHDYTLDTNPVWSQYNYQLSIKGNLPLMACLLSRTPIAHSKLLYAIFTEKEVPKELQKLFNKKPILVIYNNKVKVTGKKSEFTKSILERGPQIIKEKKMKFLLEKDGVKYYEWHLDK